MGLAMYLKARVYVSKYTEEKKALAVRKIFPDIPLCGNLDSIDLCFEVAYWRKANAIHGWFVKNVQDGEDDCKEYSVSINNLIKLRDTCVEVLDSLDKSPKDTTKAEKLLPPQGGFSFGSIDIDEWYVSDLKNTVEMLDKVIKSGYGDLIYEAVW